MNIRRTIDVSRLVGCFFLLIVFDMLNKDTNITHTHTQTKTKKNKSGVGFGATLPSTGDAGGWLYDLLACLVALDSLGLHSPHAGGHWAWLGTRPAPRRPDLVDNRLL